jgi:murein DD-endopeptidase MepM/ murein hydrolase activator NlpD
VKDKKTFEEEAASAASEASDKKEKAFPPGTKKTGNPNTTRADSLIAGGAWLVALSLVLLVGYLAWRMNTPFAAAFGGPDSDSNVQVSMQNIAAMNTGEGQDLALTPAPFLGSIAVPAFVQDDTTSFITRKAMLHTVIPTRPRDTVTEYTVVAGDSVFSIAVNFNLKPETVLWANHHLLQDKPDELSIGMVLKIPPTDGIVYQWKAGDDLGYIAYQYKAKEADIVNWPGNQVDLSNPSFAPGQMVMIPGGRREIVQWIIPTIPRGRAGVSPNLLGPGTCKGGYEGAYGTGSFAWPSSQRVISGNDYWSGHLGIDIAVSIGDNISASDSGVVVFSGWAYGGYGNMVMIDHGNGYQTLYAHLSAAIARCGQSVQKGQLIGSAGSTGNSTGPHLHFEVRYGGGFINPWNVLPK